MESKFITSTPSGISGLADYSPGERTLKNTSPMMTGPDVQFVQLRVGAAPDSIFGPKTKAAVERFQKEKGIPSTGIVDNITWAALEKTGSAVDREKINLQGSKNTPDHSLLYWGAAGVGAIGLAVLAAKALNS